MSRKTWAAGAMALGLIALAGCADNPMVLQGRVAQYQQQQSALQKQNELYQSRIDTLDRDNQRKEAMLAQQQQQTKLLEDRLAAVTDQLRSTSDKLAQVQGEKQEVDTKSRALTASLRRQAGVSITPNNGFSANAARNSLSRRSCPPRRRRHTDRTAGQSALRSGRRPGTSGGART